MIDERNVASRRVAAAVGAVEFERSTNAGGHVMIDHVVAVPAVARPDSSQQAAAPGIIE